METINLLQEDLKYQHQLSLLDQKLDMNIFLINEEIINNITLDEVASQWYNTWKGTLIQNIRTTMTRYKTFSISQIKKYEQWLKSNQQIILNHAKYPVKAGANAKRFPNIKAALNRINLPINKAINGIDIDRINLSDKTNHLWLKSYLIPKYDGKSPFDNFCKDYYSGGDTKSTLNREDTANLLNIGYEFCEKYRTIVGLIEQDGNSIITYINRDPITNQQTIPSITNSNNNRNNMMASTNPYKNANMVKEAANVPTPQNTQNSPTTVQINRNVNNKQNTSTNNINKNKNILYKKPNGEKIESTKMQKHKIVSEILKDMFNAKATAVASLYKDLMVVMQVHVSSYTNQKQ